MKTECIESLFTTKNTGTYRLFIRMCIPRFDGMSMNVTYVLSRIHLIFSYRFLNWEIRSRYVSFGSIRG